MLGLFKNIKNRTVLRRYEMAYLASGRRAARKEDAADARNGLVVWITGYAHYRKVGGVSPSAPASFMLPTNGIERSVATGFGLDKAFFFH